MGSKIESRIAMQAADVPVVPGITTNIETAEEAIEIAKQIGYPLMLKASAGGGGIGMQLMELSKRSPKRLKVIKQERKTSSVTEKCI